MSVSRNQIIVKDETIIAFYKENPSLDFIAMNHLFIDIMKSLSTNLSTTLANSTNSKILSILTEIGTNLATVKQDVYKINAELVSNVSLKLHEYKKECLDSIQLLFTNNTLSSFDKFGSILDKHNETLISSITTKLADIIPKSNEQYQQKVESAIQGLSAAMSQNTAKLYETLSSSNVETCLKEYSANVETQFNRMIISLQQPILSVIQSTDERTINGIREIREKIQTAQTTNDTLSQELNGFLNKYKHNSSTKGNISEIELSILLQQVFPTDEILDMRSETAACDYRVNRLNKSKPTILFENKDYTRPVSTEEIAKFERDISIRKCHGIFLSQNSNITYKENFQIDIQDGCILVYIPNAQYNLDKIRIAVDMVDHFSQKLACVSAETLAFQISKEEFDELTEEYAEFSRKKARIIESVRLSSKQTIDQLDEIQLCVLKRVLSRNGAISSDEEHKCRFCAFIGKNKASVAAHTRGCKSNPAKNA